MDDRERPVVFAILMVYRILLLGVLVVGSPWWLWRMVTVRRYRAGLAGRLGRLPKGLKGGTEEPGSEAEGVVWVHAVSVGEVLAATGLVRELRGAGFRVAVSTTTEAGQELAQERFAGCPVFYMPLDFGFLMTRVLDAMRPRLVVTMESELWPNLIHACKVRGVPLAVVNARVSDRSYPRYLRLRRVWRPLLQEVSLFLAQGEETAERLRAMGVERGRVSVPGNLKYAVGFQEESARTRLISTWALGRRVLVAGSTLSGEEEDLLGAWVKLVREFSDAVLVIAPRHKERFVKVLAMMQATELPVCRASALVAAEKALGGAILLLDTIGDLASLYGVAAVAFVGGSLVAKGGHNPLEAARFGVPVVMGESYFNFKEIVGGMVAAEALRIVRREELVAALGEMLRESAAARAMGERGKALFEAQAGATGRTMAALLELVERGR